MILTQAYISLKGGGGRKCWFYAELHSKIKTFIESGCDTSAGSAASLRRYEKMATNPNLVQPQVLQPQVVQQQVIIMKPQRPYPMIVENKFLMVFIMLGLVFLLLGAIFVNMAPMITNNDRSGSDHAADQHTQNTVTYIGNVFKSLGVFFIVGFLLLAAVLRNDLSDYTRFGILLLIGLIMIGTQFMIP